jgi:iron complex transport system permease protein
MTSAQAVSESRRGRLFLTTGAILLLLLVVASVCVGRYPNLFAAGIRAVFSDLLSRRLILSLRVPRVCAAVLLGMVLGAGGTVFQTIFANPLIEPGFIGVSQGGAFGAAVGILTAASSALLIQGSAAFFALLGLGLSYVLARKIRYGGWLLRLILAGIAVSAFFSAWLGLLKLFADPRNELPEITYWLMGGLWRITWERLLPILPVTLISLGVLYALRWRINLLGLDTSVAHTLGVHAPVERMITLTVATVAVAAVISISGIVQWVGLIIPHFSRRIVGADTRYSLPGSMILGGIFCLMCDNLARMVLNGEIPLGIVTAAVGTVVFVVLFSRKFVGGTG